MFERIKIDALTAIHGYQDSVKWSLTKLGIDVAGEGVTYTPGEPATVRRVWTQFGDSFTAWATKYEIPVELLVATACTETRGDAAAIRMEPGYESDEKTPGRISPGLMQTLISTARSTLAREGLAQSTIDRQWLLVADNSIHAGAAYINQMFPQTGFDPPLVACGYNAGGVYHQEGEKNRWKMRQYPIGTGEHANRFVSWFNDCFRIFASNGGAPPCSYYRKLNP